MRPKRISTRRHAPKRGGLRIFHANMKRKKHHAAAAITEGESFRQSVSGLNVGRALFIMVALHVIAVAGFFAHSKWFEQAEPALAAAADDAAASKKVRTNKGEYTAYPVKEGETYMSIAAANNVSVEALRELNDNVPLVGGKIIDIPAQVIMPAESLDDLASNVTSVEADLVAEEANAPIVLVQPRVEVVPELPAVAPPIEQASTVAAAGRVHEVKKGDTLWGISNKYKVKQADVLKLNGLKDANLIRLGQVLQIP